MKNKWELIFVDPDGKELLLHGFKTWDDAMDYKGESYVTIRQCVVKQKK